MNPELARDLPYVAAALLVMAAWQIADTRQRRAHPPADQRPGDVGQLAAALGGGCLIFIVGAVALSAVLWLFLTG